MACACEFGLDVPPLFMDWREGGDTSDWECRLGERRFRLHRNVLGWGNRRSRFFQAAFNGDYGTSSTDLTGLLPATCHAHLETVIDFMYGKAISATAENILMLVKIADILQIESLMAASSAHVGRVAGGAHTLALALDLQLPPDSIEAIAQKTPLATVLGVLEGNPQVLNFQAMVSACSRRARLEAFAADCSAKPRAVSVDDDTGELFVDISLQKQQVFRLDGGRLDGSRWACRMKILQLSDIGLTIGVTRSEFSPGCAAASDCLDGGFAREDGAWGLCLSSGRLWSEGKILGVAARKGDALLGRTVQMLVDVDRGELTLVDEGDSAELGRVPCGALEAPLFTIGVCNCANNKFRLLPSLCM